ncbi:hypothetical protein ACOSQ2_014445 [Xanthoceras sorbifolium]
MGKLQFIARVPAMYEDYLTRGLSNRIKVDQGMELCHALFRYGLMFAFLANKDVLETERSEAKKKKLCKELENIRSELVARVKREKQMAARAERYETLRADMDESAVTYKEKVCDLKAKIERTKSDL